MDSVQAIILGLIQGLTEFLPVSSSGHLTIAKTLFGIETSDLRFDVVVHAATVLATLVVFRKEILDLFKGLFKFRYNEETKYCCMILFSLIPIFIVGVFFKDYVESVFGSGLVIVGVSLIITSFLLGLSESSLLKRKGEEKGMTYRTAVWMGIAQAFAVLPGLSRSGSTIATGLICGTKKEDVARFSFLMVLIPVLGDVFLEVVGGESGAGSTGSIQLLLGFVSAFISGFFACRFMISVVRKAKLKWFALYCVIVGLTCLISSVL